MKSTSPLFSRPILPALLLAALFLAIPFRQSHAQLKEPEVIKNFDPRTPYGQDLRNRWGIDLQINNFGFGVTGHYARIVSDYTEITFEAGITGLRDVSEQNFQDLFTGRKIVPNKYNRALAFPMLLGVKQRLFARHIDDNFRFFLSASAGPAMAFVYPYLDDRDGNGFRTLAITQQGFIQPIEPVNDFFTGWKEGETKWGGAGSIALGVDLGSKFKNQTTVEFGYFFYYFEQGIQMLEPNKPQVGPDGNLVFDNNGIVQTSNEPAFSARKYFGTPRISFTFGGLW